MSWKSLMKKYFIFHKVHRKFNKNVSMAGKKIEKNNKYLPLLFWMAIFSYFYRLNMLSKDTLHKEQKNIIIDIIIIIIIMIMIVFMCSCDCRHDVENVLTWLKVCIFLTTFMYFWRQRTPFFNTPGHYSVCVCESCVCAMCFDDDPWSLFVSGLSIFWLFSLSLLTPIPPFPHHQ